MDIRRLDPGDAPGNASWDDFVFGCAQATFFHRAGWQKILRRVFRHDTHYLFAQAGQRIPLVLPLAAMSGRLSDGMLAAAQSVWPATAQRFQQRLLAELARTRPDLIPIARRRQVERLLGGQLGRGPGSNYYDAMRASEQRAAQLRAPQQPGQPPGPTSRSPLATPAQTAADPASITR